MMCNSSYYFVKSENNPTKDPLILWLNGGPGCSGLSALLFEIGPLQLKIAKYNGSLPALELNPNSWTKVANIVFLDSPVGTGFSYSTTSQGSYSTTTTSAQQSCSFIRKWLADHPEFLSNPLYVGGDSFSGLTVPIVTQHISDGIEFGIKPLLNLKGYLLGNALTDGYLEMNSKIPFAYGMGILSNELFESAKKNCGGDYVNVDPSNVQCTNDLDAITLDILGLNYEHILEPLCVFATPKPKEINFSSIIRSPPHTPGFECRNYGYMLSYYWANDDGVRNALKVRKEPRQEWMRCSNDLNYLSDVRSSTSYHVYLSSKRRYRSLMYSGDHDMRIPFLSTQAWIRSLNYSISNEWRKWRVDAHTIGGYTRTYTNNMTFTTIKGGGHTAPEYRPKECFTMVKRWLSYEPL
ncbi:hypothetical protein AQUCO_06000060v1 [Aquilegia coerulea]|uniref:Serine carboxypeptidase-like 18 n=1 Tax=Aquilegia coerulea TaxID=218851 RepID=A0A2G5CDS0_AQUCA|nr:hypothetical protein AQUCO_06000060v1 [Aquilegia coerulea]PIA29443.1 hypothetical protein AQUCO_06000060v1 [Aquilegia coerulea]